MPLANKCDGLPLLLHPQGVNEPIGDAHLQDAIVHVQALRFHYVSGEFLRDLGSEGEGLAAACGICALIPG